MNGSDPTPTPTATPANAGPTRRPVVGVTTYVERARQGVWDVPAVYLQYQYVELVARAGGTAVLLPPPPGSASASAAEEVLDRVDALVTAGGRDVDARRYGAAPHADADPPAPERDEWELALTRGALDRGTPLLGICRGAQVLAVALGGTLVQHLPDVPGVGAHRRGPGEFASHTVRTLPGSRLAGVLGPAARVSCYHHQAVADVPSGLQATAHAEDGVVEGVELPGDRFVVGVQWHPEETLDDLRLMEALVRAARGEPARPEGSDEETKERV